MSQSHWSGWRQSSRDQQALLSLFLVLSESVLVSPGSDGLDRSGDLLTIWALMPQLFGSVPLPFLLL